jgi:hypothetical protein
MKKHLLGICVALFFAFTSFYVSPIRFTEVAVGIGVTKDYKHTCHFYPQISNHFVRVYVDTCNLDTPELAKIYLDKAISNANEVIETSKESETQTGKIVRRSVIGETNPYDGHIVCVIRHDEHWVTTICSTSLRHVLEFEQQKFR